MPRKRSHIVTQSQLSEMENDFSQRNLSLTESQSELAKLYSKQQSKPRNVSSLKMMFKVHKPTKVHRGPPKSITIIQTVEPSTVEPKFSESMGDFAQVEVIPDEKNEKSKKKGGVMKWMKFQKNTPVADESVENNTVFITMNSTETAGEFTRAVESTFEEVTGSQVVESTSYTDSADNATSRRHRQDKVSLMRGLLTCCQIEITDVVLPDAAAAAANVDVPEEENSLVEGVSNEEPREEQGVEVYIFEGVSK